MTTGCSIKAKLSACLLDYLLEKKNHGIVCLAEKKQYSGIIMATFPPTSVFWEVKTKARDSEMTSVL